MVDDPSFDRRARHALREGVRRSGRLGVVGVGVVSIRHPALRVGDRLGLGDEAAKETGLVGEGLDARAIAEDGLRLVVAEEFAQLEVVGNAFGVDLPGRVARAATGVTLTMGWALLCRFGAGRRGAPNASGRCGRT